MPSKSASAKGGGKRRRGTLKQEVLCDLGGALLFGVPLVYTMEIWWLGETSSTMTLGVMTLLAAVVSGLIRFVVIGRLGWAGAMLAGFRCTAISLALAAGLAAVIGVLTIDDSASKILGEIAAIGIPLSLGAALGAVLFADPDTRESGGSDDDENRGGIANVVRDVIACALGATFIALPIAPTGEVPTINSMTDIWRIAIVVPVCILLCYTIVFASGFHERRGGSQTAFGIAAAETSISTAVGLFIAASLLFAFGMIDTASPQSQIIGYIAALSIPASIGAAAGRIAAA